MLSLGSMHSKRPSGCSTYQPNKSTNTINPSYSQDMEYLTLKDQIANNHFYRNMNKSTKIRINNWLALLDNVIVNSVWKKNRNNHAKLINLMCECEFILAPYNKYPPNGQIPNLSKHQINAIIDRVELVVKNAEKNRTSRNTTKRQRQWQYDNVQEYWERMRQMKEQSQVSMEQSNSLVGRIIDIAQKSNVVQNQQSKENFGGVSKINIVEACNMKKNKENQQKQPQTIKKETSKQVMVTSQTVQKQPKVRSGYIDLKINSPSDYFPKNKRVISELTNFEDDRPPNMFRDMRQSVELQSDTLNTDFVDCDEDQFDFNGDLSERCNERDVAVKQYFDWKKKFSNKLNTVRQKTVEVSPEESKINESNHLETYIVVKDSELIGTTRILEEQTALQIPQESSKIQELRKFYWQQNFSDSDDFQYIESPQKITIESNLDSKSRSRSRSNSVLQDITTDVIN